MPPQDSPNDSVKRLLPWLVAIAVFMESLDTTILNTAVPAIAAALQVAPLSMKAVLSSYTLSLAVFIPVSGWMADRYGTRRVFSSAIGMFTIGSILCGISTSIHMLVFCRILQGCGGAMMVPVGRLTMVRTFAKSELIRAMSFVAVPALIGPMLGPVAGGLIVGFLHWRMIFFINVPIGLLGLYFIYRHLPDYREERIDPLDIIGMILFGAGVALLSYVLEVFGEHTLSGRGNTGPVGAFHRAALGLWAPRDRDTTSAAASRPVSHPNFPRRSRRRLHHASGRGWNAFSSSAALPGRTRLHAGAIRIPDYASSPRGNELENVHASRAHALWLPPGADLQHGDHWRHPRAVRHHRAGHAGLAHRASSLLLRILFLAAIHEYEYARVRRCHVKATPAWQAPSQAPFNRCRSASALQRPRW